MGASRGLRGRRLTQTIRDAPRNTLIHKPLLGLSFVSFAFFCGYPSLVAAGPADGVDEDRLEGGEVVDFAVVA